MLLSIDGYGNFCGEFVGVGELEGDFCSTVGDFGGGIVLSGDTRTVITADLLRVRAPSLLLETSLELGTTEGITMADDVTIV